MMRRHFLGVLSVTLLAIAYVQIERYQPFSPNGAIAAYAREREGIAATREALREIIKHDQFVRLQAPPSDIREWATERLKIAVEKDQEAQKQEEALRQRETELRSIEENKAAANAFSSRIIAVTGFLGLIAGALQMIIYIIAGLRGIA